MLYENTQCEQENKINCRWVLVKYTVMHKNLRKSHTKVKRLIVIKNTKIQNNKTQMPPLVTDEIINSKTSHLL